MKKKMKIGNAQVSKLHEALKQGTSPVGLKGYVATDFYDAEMEEVPIIIKVEITELKADCNGVSVMVKPAAGNGTFKISPCKWFDTPTQFEAKLEAERILLEAKEAWDHIMGHSLMTARKDRLLNLAIQSEGLLNTLKSELIEAGFASEETTENQLLRKVPEGTLARLALALVAIKYQVDEGELRSKLHWRF